MKASIFKSEMRKDNAETQRTLRSAERLDEDNRKRADGGGTRQRQEKAAGLRGLRPALQVASLGFTVDESAFLYA